MVRRVSEESIATNGVSAVTAWTVAFDLLRDSHKYWLATSDPDGRPHVVPVFAVWVDGCAHFTAGPASRKARNLAHEPRCSLGTVVKKLDVVVEGDATRLEDEGALQRVADAYVSTYGWPVTARNGRFDADYGAPSAGPPPYDVYRLEPDVAYGFGTAAPFGATRWRFADDAPRPARSRLRRHVTP